MKDVLYVVLIAGVILSQLITTLNYTIERVSLMIIKIRYSTIHIKVKQISKYGPELV